MKRLVQDCGGDIHSEEFIRGLLEWRNTPHATGKSPAQLMYGRPIRSIVPSAPSALGGEDKEIEDKKREIANRRKEYYDCKGTQELPELKQGDRVRVRDFNTNKWSHIGTVQKKRATNSYHIKFDTGGESLRTRRDIKLDITSKKEEKPENTETKKHSSQRRPKKHKGSQPRRTSGRKVNKPARYGY